MIKTQDREWSLQDADDDDDGSQSHKHVQWSWWTLPFSSLPLQALEFNSSQTSSSWPSSSLRVFMKIYKCVCVILHIMEPTVRGEQTKESGDSEHTLLIWSSWFHFSTFLFPTLFWTFFIFFGCLCSNIREHFRQKYTLRSLWMI